MSCRFKSQFFEAFELRIPLFLMSIRMVLRKILFFICKFCPRRASAKENFAQAGQILPVESPDLDQSPFKGKSMQD
ncbi:hypothetical protein LF95_23655 [Thalassospira sp. TSL5-1]|nr:hypothetical protein LF95_23655 [Thalassospira sp. TSL5-1]